MFLAQLAHEMWFEGRLASNRLSLALVGQHGRDHMSVAVVATVSDLIPHWKHISHGFG